MTDSQLKRKLRDLRQLEQLLRGGTPTFDEFFSLNVGAPARYPFSILLVFDDASRSIAFQEFLDALWGAEPEAAKKPNDGEAFAELASYLGLSSTSSRAEVVSAFRATLKDLHPDTGGDHELAVELIRLYRAAIYPSAKRS
ncbi:MAG: hypothetical protein ACLFNT_03675 [Spirochaetales bacterium]